MSSLPSTALSTSVPQAAVECMVFSGTGGAIMLGLLAFGGVAAFVGLYYYRRFVSGTELRHPRVFFYDLAKMLCASASTGVTNYVFTAKMARVARHVHIRGGAKPLEGIGWYAALCTADAFIGAPVAILLGRLLSRVCWRQCQRLPRRSSWWLVFRQNAHFGQYSEAQVAGKPYVDEVPPLDWTWLYSQTVAWTCCSLLSSILTGVFLLATFSPVPSAWNPVAWFAVSVTYWNVHCLIKQWVVVLFSKTVLAYVRLTVVDFFNKYTSDDHRAL